MGQRGVQTGAWGMHGSVWVACGVHGSGVHACVLWLQAPAQRSADHRRTIWAISVFCLLPGWLIPTSPQFICHLALVTPFWSRLYQTSVCKSSLCVPSCLMRVPVWSTSGRSWRLPCRAVLACRAAPIVRTCRTAPRAASAAASPARVVAPGPASPDARGNRPNLAATRCCCCCCNWVHPPACLLAPLYLSHRSHLYRSSRTLLATHLPFAPSTTTSSSSSPLPTTHPHTHTHNEGYSCPRCRRRHARHGRQR